MDSINLLQETIDELKTMGKNENDVIWVGNDKVSTSWEHFTKIANVDYSNGYGGAEIDGSLLVVGSDFWLERHEYDGSEWWEYKTLPKKPELEHNFKSVYSISVTSHA